MVVVPPSIEKETNIMTPDELDLLRESYSFPPHMQLRIPEEGETITSTRPGKGSQRVAKGSQCPARPQRVAKGSQSVANIFTIFELGRGAISLWHAYKYAMPISEFKHLFSLNNKPKPDHDWLYFKARYKKTLLRGYPSNVKGWKKKIFFTSRDDWEFFKGSSQEYGVSRVPKSWGIPGRHSSSPDPAVGSLVLSGLWHPAKRIRARTDLQMMFLPHRVTLVSPVIPEMNYLEVATLETAR
ncbi:hypothetical protein Acr_00g0077920 [Actinidia rufa]|uniref:Uncharacterized protein n=1 Tax=Actinidia rufa TaxID=165716 RepID=A0A7J0DUQ6_9ERIC|nr:hypothetical protein Acr_00g0077920 [Actinidia rufa]